MSEHRVNMIGISRSMYCFVKLPNSVVLDVEVDPKADAQECLQKVLAHLNIIESDYFGLQYISKEGTPTWLNLRNPIDQQLGLAGPAPHRLSLRVKFFVQPHRLLQTATKHQFYLNVKEDFLAGRLRLVNEQEAIVLAAYIAQAEGGDLGYHPLYTTLLPPQYRGGRQNVTEDNPPMTTRSRHSSSNSTGSSHHHRLRHCSGGMESSSGSEDEEMCDNEQLINSDSLEYGSPSSDEHLVAMLAQEHKKLSGTTVEAAEYGLLQAAAQLSCYGMEYFQVGLEPSSVAQLYGERNKKHIKSPGQHYLGVGPEGVHLYNGKWKLKQQYPYPRVHRITNYHRCFSLVIFNDDASDFAVDFRLSSKTAASALYRCMTEMYCFYLCETVRDNVTTQFSRDLKGTLASLFNENSTVGKKYTFDIQRTSNEAYDFYRRTLYKAGTDTSTSSASVLSPGCTRSRNNSGKSDNELTATAPSVTDSPNCEAMRRQLQEVQDAVLCCLCVDARLSVVFKPCQHVVCCTTCAQRVTSCPFCRQEIQSCEPIFMPSVPSKDEQRTAFGACSSTLLSHL